MNRIFKMTGALLLTAWAAGSASAAPVASTKWIAPVGTQAFAYYSAVAADNSGDSYVVGEIYGTIFGTSTDTIEGFLAKFDPNGNLLSSTLTPNEQYYGVTVDSSGNEYVLDHSGSVQKFNSTGALLWTNRIPNGVVDSPTIAVDKSGNVFAAAYNGSTNPPGSALVSKFDSLGNLLWTRTPPSASSRSDTIAVAVDPAGDVVMVGSNMTSNGSPSNGYGAAYDPQGNLLWSRQFGLPGSFASATGVGADSAGSIYIAERLTSSSGMLMKYDAANDLLWSSSVSGSAGPMPLTIDPNGREFVLTNSLVAAFDTSGKQIQQIPVSNSLNDLAYDQGNLFVASFQSGVPPQGLMSGFLTDFQVPEPPAAILCGAAALGIIGLTWSKRMRRRAVV